ncbi:MAG TPA: hypothetical protein VGI99_14500, partial [Gemmataceae bacterium]
MRIPRIRFAHLHPRWTSEEGAPMNLRSLTRRFWQDVVRARRPRTRLNLEPVEDRVVPAFDLALSNAATVGVTSNDAAGTRTFTATATGANLDWADVAIALNNNLDVVISNGNTGAENGDITDSTGAQLTILNNKTITIHSDPGATVGAITLQDIALDGLGESFLIKAKGDLQTGSL